jgi:hypothetical protein
LSPQAQDLRITTELHDSFPVRTIPSDRLAPGPPARPRAAASSKLAKPGWTKTLPAAHNVNKVSLGASPACASSPRSARSLLLGLLVLVSLRPARRFTIQVVRATPLSTLYPSPRAVLEPCPPQLFSLFSVNCPTLILFLRLLFLHPHPLSFPFDLLLQPWSWTRLHHEQSP